MIDTCFRNLSSELHSTRTSLSSVLISSTVIGNAQGNRLSVDRHRPLKVSWSVESVHNFIFMCELEADIFRSFFCDHVVRGLT